MADAGDESFEKFLREQSQQGATPFFVMITIREKLHGVIELYKATLEAYEKVPTGHKTKLERFSAMLMKKAEQAIDQFDFLIADSAEGDEPDPDGKGETDDSGPS